MLHHFPPIHGAVNGKADAYSPIYHQTDTTIWRALAYIHPMERGRIQEDIYGEFDYGPVGGDHVGSIERVDTGCKSVGRALMLSRDYFL